MISKKMQKSLNEQLNAEFGAWYLYLSMSAYCTSLSLDGVAAWFSRQSEEEKTHAMKIYEYLLEQDAPVELLPLAKPESNFSSVEDCFKKTLENEKHVTKLINDLMDIAVSEKDYTTQIFLQWFVTEQLEEESSVQNILEKLKLLKDSSQGLFLFDKELADGGGEH